MKKERIYARSPISRDQSAPPSKVGLVLLHRPIFRRNEPRKVPAAAHPRTWKDNPTAVCPFDLFPVARLRAPGLTY